MRLLGHFAENGHKKPHSLRKWGSGRKREPAILICGWLVWRSAAGFGTWSR